MNGFKGKKRDLYSFTSYSDAWKFDQKSILDCHHIIENDSTEYKGNIVGHPEFKSHNADRSKDRDKKASDEREECYQGRINPRKDLRKKRTYGG